jgi:hypothetical protein
MRKHRGEFKICKKTLGMSSMYQDKKTGSFKYVSRNQHKSAGKQPSACHLFHAGFLLGLFFNPKDGDEMFL